jgi:hypothetical protein
MSYTSAINYHIQSTECLFDLLNHGHHLIIPTDITFDQESLAFLAFNESDCFFSLLAIHPGIVDNDFESKRSKFCCTGATYTGGGSCYESYFFRASCNRSFLLTITI